MKDWLNRKVCLYPNGPEMVVAEVMDDNQGLLNCIWQDSDGISHSAVLHKHMLRDLLQEQREEDARKSFERQFDDPWDEYLGNAFRKYDSNADMDQQDQEFWDSL